ncbi:MAG TPA: hypothetical protein VFK26_06670 [Gemmatimonadaceae bacterium]|jgi:hypothetical protein|nr:hypothetical protein [Gemmatimonadaceae bacterium]
MADTHTNRDTQPHIPTDTDELAPGSAEEKRANNPNSTDDRTRDRDDVNPPRTTSGKNFTAPKFGSAGSGGLEFEPGPERD